MKKVVIATNNAHKVSEISTALDFPGWEFVTLRECGDFPEPLEDADTFVGNARIKARAAFEATGLAALADDSGLEVDVLNGAPGVFSARYAGEHGDDDANNAKVLSELEGIADSDRTARFVCALVFIDVDGTEYTARGTIEGKIGYNLQGNGGFGYDPMFFPDEFKGTKSLAEVTQAEKNAISHRGNALRQLKASLVDNSI